MDTKACIRIWNSSDEILEYFGIETMACLEEVGPSELKLKYVIENKDASREEISELKKVNIDLWHKYLANPIKLNTSVKYYVKKIEQEIKRDVVMKLFDGELQLENM
jgi:hypothetical protein